MVVIQLVEWLLLTPESSHGQFFDYKQFRKDQNTEKEPGMAHFKRRITQHHSAESGIHFNENSFKQNTDLGF